MPISVVSILLSSTCTFSSFLKVRDHRSHHYITEGKADLYIYDFWYLDVLIIIICPDIDKSNYTTLQKGHQLIK